MSDLEILAKFRQAEAAGIIHTLTESMHDCVRSGCEHCIAKPACRAIVNSSRTNSFDTNYRNWAKRTMFHDLPYLQQHCPEHLI